MSDQYQYDFTPVTDIEPGDMLRLQRLEGGQWRDYRYPLEAIAYIDTTITFTDIFNIGPDFPVGAAAPSGKAYLVLPYSYVQHIENLTTVANQFTVRLRDRTETTTIAYARMLIRAGEANTAPLGVSDATPSQVSTSVCDELTISIVADVNSGLGELYVRVYYVLVDI